MHNVIRSKPAPREAVKQPGIILRNLRATARGHSLPTSTRHESSLYACHGPLLQSLYLIVDLPCAWHRMVHTARVHGAPLYARPCSRNSFSAQHSSPVACWSWPTSYLSSASWLPAGMRETVCLCAAA